MKKKSKGGSGFKYHERSGEDLQKRAEQKGGQFDSVFKSGVDRWRAKDGENIIRILPPTWEEHDHYGYDIWVHSYVGADKSTYLCPQKMLNKPCPICKAARDAKAAGEEDEAKQLAATRRVVAWIIDRDDEKPTPSLYDMSWSMDRDIAALCHNKRTGKVLLIDHPDQGYDIMFTRTGKGLGTRYIGLAVDREDSPIMSDADDQEKVLEYIQENPIPDLLNFYDEAYLKRMIEGGDDERDEDLDDDADAPRDKKKPAPSSKRRPAADDDDDEDDASPPPPRSKSKSRPRDEEPDEEEDDAEEEAPRSAKRAKPDKKRARDEDEEEVVEEDDEDDAPPPRSKSKRPADDDEDVEDDVEEDASDEEEEEVVEEDDEDDAPPKKKAVAGKPGRLGSKPRAGRR